MTSYHRSNDDVVKYRGARRYYDEYDEYEDDYCLDKHYDDYHDGYGYDGYHGYEPKRQVVRFQQPKSGGVVRNKGKSKLMNNMFNPNRNRVRFADNYGDDRDEYNYSAEGEADQQPYMYIRQSSPDSVSELHEGEEAGRRSGLAEAACMCFGQEFSFNVYKNDDDAGGESPVDACSSVPRDATVSEVKSRGDNPQHQETVPFTRMASNSLREAADGLQCFHDDVQSGLQYIQDDTLEMLSRADVDPDLYRLALMRQGIHPDVAHMVLPYLLRQIAESRSRLQVPGQLHVEGIKGIEQGVPDDQVLDEPTTSVRADADPATVWREQHCNPARTEDYEVPVATSGGETDTVMSTRGYKTRPTRTRPSFSSSTRKVRNPKLWKWSAKAEF
mmetsp:Transcript_24910/g.55188  ORF Transcript_24910/g.55188 Transcript_24910/m.55188 type:complete len:387 (-) Transcript_24910:1114-2274(-)